MDVLQDWVVERRLRMVPGVSDVLVLGGKTKEFQAEIDLTRMRAFGVSIPQIINAAATNNANVGGRTIAMGEQAVNVRGVGIVRTLPPVPGRRTVNTEPLPGSLATVTLPPIMCASCARRRGRVLCRRIRGLSLLKSLPVRGSPAGQSTWLAYLARNSLTKVVRNQQRAGSWSYRSCQ
jgi:multidrug efflux pump subunit AcrB